MTITDELTARERRFWTEGADFYARALAPTSRMLVPGVGTMERDAIIAGLRDAPRWARVEMADVHALPLGEDSAVLSYRAIAGRDGDAEDYAALVSSVYVRVDGAWLLAFHHQSPLG